MHVGCPDKHLELLETPSLCHFLHLVGLLQPCILSCSTLEKLQPRVVSYEEQVTAIREQLADVLIDEEDWNQAAKTLAGIDLDSGELPCTFAEHCPKWPYLSERRKSKQSAMAGLNPGMCSCQRKNI